MRRVLTAFTALALTVPAVAQGDAAPKDYDSFVPSTELSTATELPPDTALVRRLFTLAFTEPCNAAIDGGYGGTEPQVFDLTYKGSYDEPDAPERKFRLYQFNCNGGAYNFSSVFYGWDEIDGLQPLSLPSPSVMPTYDDAADNGDGKLVGLEVTGMTASFLATNATVDPGSGTIATAAYWRGIGDASSVGAWSLADGEYRLVTYDVDASYDGEVNPVRVYDRSEPEEIALP